MVARMVSVLTHLRMPWSSAIDIPKVDLPVPGHPAIRISLGMFGCAASLGLLRKARDDAPSPKASMPTPHQAAIPNERSPAKEFRGMGPTKVLDWSSGDIMYVMTKW